MSLWTQYSGNKTFKVERYGRYKMQNLKKKRGEKNVSPVRDRTWVASVTDQHDNHYTTPIADSISEIKYLYR